VRILELIATPSGDSVQLEGNRLPITHSGEVITRSRAERGIHLQQRELACGPERR
jgi:hypothetical protein